MSATQIRRSEMEGRLISKLCLLSILPLVGIFAVILFAGIQQVFVPAIIAGVLGEFMVVALYSLLHTGNELHKGKGA